MPGTTAGPAIRLWALLHLTHAAIQAIADECGADILHIKGPAVDAALRTEPRRSRDTDVIVRPAHLDRFLAALARHGWAELTGFAEGSSFRHASNYHHRTWAHVDVHRFFPGPTATPAAVFDALWADRYVTELAHTACAVPGLAAQLMVLGLHEARAHTGADTFEAWQVSTEATRDEAWSLARRLGAEVPLAAAVGRLDEYRGRRDYLLWKFWSQPEGEDAAASRLAEWTARLHAAPTLQGRVAVLIRMVRVNRTHLRMELGHEPSGREVAAEYRHRIAAGVHALGAHRRGPAR